MAEDRPLTAMQSRFVDILLTSPTMTPTEAARRAGYSVATADRQASRLMQDPRIRSAIEARRRELQQETQVTQRRVIEGYARIAFADPADYFTWGPDGVTVRSWDELTPDQRMVIAEVSQDRHGTTRVKLADRLGALDALAKHLGLFREQVDVTVSGGVVVLPPRHRHDDLDDHDDPDDGGSEVR